MTPRLPFQGSSSTWRTIFLLSAAIRPPCPRFQRRTTEPREASAASAPSAIAAFLFDPRLTPRFTAWRPYASCCVRTSPRRAQNQENANFRATRYPRPRTRWTERSDQRISTVEDSRRDSQRLSGAAPQRAATLRSVTKGGFELST